MEWNWTTFALEIINFAILVWLLTHFLYRPVLRAIASRKEQIAKTLADAQQRLSEGESLQRQYESRLTEWSKEKASLRSAFDAELAAERQKQLAALQAELDAVRRRDQAATAAQARTMELAAEQRALEQSARFCARLLERLASPGLESSIVAAAIDDLHRIPRERREVIARDAGGNHALRVTSRFPVAPEQRAALRDAVRALTGGEPVLEFAEDPALIAGIRFDLGSWAITADLADELRSFAQGQS